MTHKQQRLLFIIGGCLWFFALSCFAQDQTLVTGTIVDSDSITWANGSWQAQLNNPRGGQVKFIDGSGIPQTVFPSVSLSSGGTLSQNIPSNAAIAPAGTTWTFTFCPDASSNCSQLSPLTVSGSSYSISSYATANITAPRFPATGANMYGYGDVEVDPTPTAGGFYFNVNTLNSRQWNGTAWQNWVGGSAGCPLTGCTFTGPISDTNAGLFNSTYKSYISAIINGASPASIYAAFTTAGTNLDGSSGAVNIPGGSGQYQVNGISGYIDNNSPTTAGVAVGGYTRCLPNALHCWGANMASIDVSGDSTTTRTMYGAELDTQPQNSASHYFSLLGVASILFAPVAGTYGAPFGGAFVAGRGQAGNWDTGFHCQAGACNTGINLEQSNATAASSSPDIKFSSYNGTSIFTDHIFEDSAGLTHFQADNGAGGLSLEGNVAPNGFNLPSFSITANYTLTTQDGLLNIDASSNAVTVTLPASPAIVSGTLRYNTSKFYVFRADSSTNTVTINGNGSLVNGSSSITIPHGAYIFSYDQSSSQWSTPLYLTTATGSQTGTVTLSPGSGSTPYGQAENSTAYNQANGFAGLDSSAKILTAQLPNSATQSFTPSLNQAACIKAVGPPVIIGWCSTAVSGSGACTCN